MPGVWYFAYGSNMQRATLCGRRGIVCQRALGASVAGWRIVFDKPPLFPIGESFANLVPDSAAQALGVLYEMAADDFRHLELSEGVPIGNYESVTVTARPLVSDDEPEVEAYTLTSPRRSNDLKPSRRYMDLVIAGAIEHQLPASYVEYLRSVPAGEGSAVAKMLRPLIDAAIRRR